MNAKSVQTLSPELIRRLTAIFNLHGWPIEGDEIFNRFCQLLRIMDKEQQECILELTRRFLRIDFGKYPYHIGQALAKLGGNALDKFNKIYIFPIREEKDFGKQKSSTFVAYGLHEFRSSQPLATKTVNIIDTPNGLPKNFNLTPSLLLLVDDFIGTGETAESCINCLTQKYGINSDKVIVLALVVQREGYRKITDMGMKLVYSEWRVKGITDVCQQPQKQDLIETMMLIEDKLNFDFDIRFGYKRSEALVKMIRTPNNTFPLYWSSKSVFKFNPPFPR